MIAAHNLLDPIRPSALGWFAPVWSLLHVQGVVVNTPGHVVLAAYPLIPWVGVTAAGFGLGAVVDWPVERRRRLFLRVGIALTAAFVVVATGQQPLANGPRGTAWLESVVALASAAPAFAGIVRGSIDLMRSTPRLRPPLWMPDMP